MATEKTTEKKKGNAMAFFRMCGSGVKVVMDWLTEQLQIKVLLAMCFLGAFALVNINVAYNIVIHTPIEEFTGEKLALVMALVTLAGGAVGSLATLAKDLLAPAPGKSEGHDLFMEHMRTEHKHKTYRKR